MKCEFAGEPVGGKMDMQANRPNIVVIMADQMIPDVIGALGHPAVKTPHIDSLVHGGVSRNRGEA